MRGDLSNEIFCEISNDGENAQNNAIKMERMMGSYLRALLLRQKDGRNFLQRAPIECTKRIELNESVVREILFASEKEKRLCKQW